jgi:hypothetical protein
MWAETGGYGSKAQKAKQRALDAIPINAKS